MNKTAVEWLIEQLNKEGFAQVVTDVEIEQAKQMEKEQIENAFNYGQFDLGMESKEYYNEIYETQND